MQVRGRRVAVAASLAALVLAALAHAQVWTPTISPKPIEDMVVRVGVWAVRLGAILILIFAVVKIIQGRAEVSTGISGIAARGHSTVFEAFSAIFWFGVLLVLLPFLIWIMAESGLLPPYVAQLMSEIYKNIFNANI
jgi:hypothetical protein